MWVVVTTPGAHFGQVGLVKRADWDNKFERKVSVQFGSSGPFRSYVKGNLLVVKHLVWQIEQNTGCRYGAEVGGD